MKSYILCPVSDKQIDESVARISAALALALISIFGLTQSLIPVAFLAVDFLLRSVNLPACSPLALASRSIASTIGFGKNYINAGPKIFAARLGLFMTCLIIILLLLNAGWPAYMLAGILGLLTFLEAAFGICVACEIYPYLYRFLYKPDNKSKSY
jgi:hypothetical protein